MGRHHTIVVGAGASGAVIAARLSERSDLDVLLLEAGPDYPAELLPPALADGRKTVADSHGWGDTYQPNPTMGRGPFLRGKVVGGSSAINSCVAMRGQPSDYDDWARFGRTEWSWASCLPAFLRLERDLDFPDSPLHGDTGPLPVRRHSEAELVPWQRGFAEAARSQGFPELLDVNEPGATGIGRHAMNKVVGRRVSVAEAYLSAEVRGRANFTLQANRRVVRVVIEAGRVVGVEVEHNRTVERVEASRVLLCAGAIGTAAILVRSGIGPRADLRRLNIELVRDLPVGKRLLDHPSFSMFFRARRGLPVSTDDPFLQMVLLTKLGDGASRNDVQIQAGSFLSIGGSAWPGVSLLLSLTKPKSVGSVEFGPGGVPVINSGLVTHADDLALAVRGMRLLRELAHAAPLRALGRPIFPPRGVVRSKKLCTFLLPHTVRSSYHPCGTAAMGQVTDSFGRIDGIAGLRVCDASLMPSLPGANVYLSVLMIGERFGEWLRNDLD